MLLIALALLVVNIACTSVPTEFTNIFRAQPDFHTKILTDTMTLYWSIREETATIGIISNSVGWVALGLSDSGGNLQYL
jgi:hypothetical protein